jgi:transcriptional regulator with XRE-family HTH domain
MVQLTAPIKEALASSVRARRARLGLTQEALAHKVGIEPQYVQMIEYGKANITLAVFLALADALQVSPAQLIKGIAASKSA